MSGAMPSLPEELHKKSICLTFALKFLDMVQEKTESSDWWGMEVIAP